MAVLMRGLHGPDGGVLDAPLNYDISEVVGIGVVGNNDFVIQFEQNVQFMVGFEEPVQSVKINGIPHSFTQSGNIVTISYIKRVSGVEGRNVCNIEVFDGTNTYTREITVDVVWPYEAPQGMVDSSSIFYNQEMPPEACFRLLSPFTYAVVDFEKAVEQQLFANSVTDWITIDWTQISDAVLEDVATWEAAAPGFIPARWTTTLERQNEAPVLSPIYDEQVALGATKIVSLTATDPDGDAVTFSLGELHAGHGLMISGNQLYITPTEQDVEKSPFTVMVVATDKFGKSHSQTFELTAYRKVSQKADLPAVSGSSMEEFSLDLASYFEGAVRYEVTGLPAGSGLSFDDVSTISGTFDTADVLASPYTLTVRAYGLDETWVENTIQFMIVAANDAPILLEDLPNQVGTEDAAIETINVASYFHDPNGDPLTFTMSVSHAGSGLRISPTGIISGRLTLSDAQASPFVVTVTATDIYGAQVQGTFTFTITLLGPIRGIHSRLVAADGTPRRNMSNVNWALYSTRNGTLMDSGTLSTDYQGRFSIETEVGVENTNYFMETWLADETMSGESARVQIQTLRPTQNNALGIIFGPQDFTTAIGVSAGGGSALVGSLF